DTGPGIPESKQDLIFKEFQRLEETAACSRGLGLGLSIVERIGRVLGTPIELTSRVGHGSTFSVLLPRAQPRAAPVSKAPTTATPGPIAGCVTLCIDNEPVVLEGMQTLLSGWGCHVLAAHDIASAITAVKGSGLVPDVVLADYHLNRGT